MGEAAEHCSSGVVTKLVPLLLRLPLPGEQLSHPMKCLFAELFNVRSKDPGDVHESWNVSAISGDDMLRTGQNRTECGRGKLVNNERRETSSIQRGLREAWSRCGISYYAAQWLKQIKTSFRNLLVITRYDGRRKVLQISRQFPAVQSYNSIVDDMVRADWQDGDTDSGDLRVAVQEERLSDVGDRLGGH